MKVMFSANGKLREALKGDVELYIEASSCSLHDAIRLVGEQLQPGQRDLLLDEDQHTVHQHILLAVNDEMVTEDEWLRDGDRISVLMPMAGG
ncbi:hypothetical protein XYCOK13_24740 [Xylanibacillus composti]|uniref:MoaD/ThiS family protein n=2 Tax=Xylanibacillus composti TaxID=1572762 RepID=A0A8J4M321_9BACL|nr:hypothetical protein XYCOK13_24740 [Xylanibacillus composti]